MKKIKSIFSIVLLLAVTISCTEESGISSDTSVSNTPATDLSKVFSISTDNTGEVIITPTGEGIVSFAVEYGDGSGEEVTVLPGSNTMHVYAEGSYTVTITATDIAGVQTTSTYPLVMVYRAPENLVITKSIAGSDLTVSAEADYANGFLVYYGDVENEVGTPMAVGETLPPHTYAAPGVYNLTVVALSGGAATTEATESVTIYAPFSLPITYESPIQNYSIGGTFGGVAVAKVANPFPGGINTTANVWQYTKPAGAESWSGTWTPLAAPDGVPINTSNGNKITVMVYASEAGKMLNVEIEQGSNGVPNQVLKMPITVANQWQQLVFDFGPNGIPAGTTFKQLVFRYNDAAAGAGEVIYIDNVTQTN